MLYFSRIFSKLSMSNDVSRFPAITIFVGCGNRDRKSLKCYISCILPSCVKSPLWSSTSPGGTTSSSVWLWVSDIHTKRTVSGACGISPVWTTSDPSHYDFYSIFVSLEFVANADSYKIWDNGSFEDEYWKMISSLTVTLIFSIFIYTT